MFGGQHAQRVGAHPGRRPVERQQLLGKLGRRFDGGRSPDAHVQQAIGQLLERHECLFVQGVERDDPQILRSRGLELSTPMQRTAELERGFGPMGLEIDKACPDLDGLFEPALAQEETSQTAQRGHLVGLARQQFAIGALGGIDAAGPVVALCVPNRPIPDVEGFAQKARERRYGLPSRWPNPLEPSHWCCLGTAGSQVNCANIFGGQSAGAIQWRASHQGHRPLARRGRHHDRPDHYPQFSSGRAEQGSR